MTTESRYLNVVRELGFTSYKLESAKTELEVYRGSGVTTVAYAKWLLGVLLDRMHSDPYLHNSESTIEHLEAARASLESINYGDFDNEDLYL